MNLPSKIQLLSHTICTAISYRNPMIGQIIRFGMVGATATGVHVATVLAMMRIAIPPPSQVEANGIAFMVANIFSYLLNSLWSFSTPLRGTTYLKFLLISMICFLGTLLIAFVAERVGLTPVSGLILVVCSMTPISFILHRFWTFR